MTLSVHWDNNLQDLAPIDLVKVSQESGIHRFTLAFITDAGQCFPAWGAQASYALNTAWGKPMIDSLTQNKIDFMISLGGAANNDLSLFCSDAPCADKTTSSYCSGNQLQTRVYEFSKRFLANT